MDVGYLYNSGVWRNDEETTEERAQNRREALVWRSRPFTVRLLPLALGSGSLSPLPFTAPWMSDPGAIGIVHQAAKELHSLISENNKYIPFLKKQKHSG